jgi:hypothetical protein
MILLPATMGRVPRWQTCGSMRAASRRRPPGFVLSCSLGRGRADLAGVTDSGGMRNEFLSVFVAYDRLLSHGWVDIRDSPSDEWEQFVNRWVDWLRRRALGIRPLRRHGDPARAGWPVVSVGGRSATGRRSVERASRDGASAGRRGPRTRRRTRVGACVDGRAAGVRNRSTGRRRRR